MITLITGAPGSGKTLFVVARYLIEAVEKPIKVIDHEGVEKLIQRRILTNINGLVLDHEKIDDSEEHGLKGWHKWARPGDLIVYDEVQRVWENAPNGSKLPDHIKELQTHRHYGVDFVIMTQGPGLIHTAVRDLIGCHLEIRRLGALSQSIVYEWDRCSRALNYKNAFKKYRFAYPKKVFKLYKSSSLHTPVKRSLPGVIWFLAASLIASAFLLPTAFNRIVSRDQENKESSTEKKHVNSQIQATPVKLTPRLPPDSDNALTVRPQLDDLILTGQISGDPHLSTWQWVQSGTVRASLTGQMLGAYGYQVKQWGACTVHLIHVSSGRSRDFACMPGLPGQPLTSTQAPAVAPSSPLI